MKFSRQQLIAGCVIFLLVMGVTQYMMTGSSSSSHTSAAREDTSATPAIAYLRTKEDAAAAEKASKAEREANEAVDSESGERLDPQKRCEKRLEIFAKQFDIQTEDYLAKHPDAMNQCLASLKQ